MDAAADNPVLIGRSGEQNRLDELLDAARAGHSRALVVRGNGHVIDELEDEPNQDAETAIRAARCPLVAPSADLAHAPHASRA